MKIKINMSRWEGGGVRVDGPKPNKLLKQERGPFGQIKMSHNS